MIDKLIAKLKEIWHTRLFSITGGVALVIIYLEIFHWDILNQFYRQFFLVLVPYIFQVCKPIVTNLVNNPLIMTGITSAAAAWIAWIKKKGDHDDEHH